MLTKIILLFYLLHFRILFVWGFICENSNPNKKHYHYQLLLPINKKTYYSTLNKTYYYYQYQNKKKTNPGLSTRSCPAFGTFIVLRCGHGWP